MRMKLTPLALSLILFCSFTAKAETQIVPRGGFSLDIPSTWKILDAHTYPDAPVNVCFPRFQGEDCRIDSVVWPEKTKEEGLKAFKERMPRLYSEGITREIKTVPFIAVSGVNGLLFVFEYERPKFGPQRFHRYIFENSRGQVICLGGQGNLDRVDVIARSSLKLIPAQ